MNSQFAILLAPSSFTILYLLAICRMHLSHQLDLLHRKRFAMTTTAHHLQVLFVSSTASYSYAQCSPATCQLRGPSSPPPDYTRVDRASHNVFFMGVFQRALDGQLDTPLTGDGYDRISRSIRALAIQYRASDSELRQAALQVLRNLIPLWLPQVFRTVFVRFDTKLSSKMCALVTLVTTQWLMGHSKISDEDKSVVEIERCRYLEEAGCVNVCLNSCKLPTEQYFEESKLNHF